MKNSKNTTATNNNNTNNVIEIVENTNNVSLETKANETTEVTETTETKEVVFKEIDYSKTYKDLNINTNNFAWNNINKNTKEFFQPRVQSFIEYRSNLFNDFVYLKNDVFVMLQTMCIKDNDNIHKFRASDTKVLHFYNNKLNDFINNNNNLDIDYNNCFTALELLDIKQRLYCYSYTYWYKVLNVRDWKNNNAHNKTKDLTTNTINRISQKYEVKNLEILNDL